MTTATTVHLEVPDLAGVAHVDDDVLVEWMREWAEARRVIDAGLAVLAGQVHARSTVEHGYAGLAQRTGARTPDAFVSHVTGASGPESRNLVSVGTLLRDPSPWLTEVAAGVAVGDVSVGVAAAIQQGLGAPNADVAADDLMDAAHRVLLQSGNLPPEKVARHAREVRDELDADGVADREAALRERRYLRLTQRPDGMTAVNGLLDPETAATWTGSVDLVTAPRRGGPRFVDPAAKARADAIVADERTTEQLTLDAVTEMIRIAGKVDDGRVFGTRKPEVHVHVSAHDLAGGRGAAVIEGQSAAVSIPTVVRLGCASGYLTIAFDGIDAFDLGRTRRLYTGRQRDILAAIWGGCTAPGCDRPPSWTEAHHIREWEDGGATSIENGILLCRHHHMWVHNRGYSITRDDDGYWLNPPPGDLTQRRKLESKNPVRRRALISASAEKRN